MRWKPSPPTVLAGVALFFALGGTAVAVSDAVKPQARCATGAVRGIAGVTGDPAKGIANLPGTFTGNKGLFSRKFNCSGGATQVRRVSQGLYEVRFVGNAAQGGVVAGGTTIGTVQFAERDVHRGDVSAGGAEPPVRRTVRSLRDVTTRPKAVATLPKPRPKRVAAAVGPAHLQRGGPPLRRRLPTGVCASPTLA